MEEKLKQFSNKIEEVTFLVNKALLEIDQQRDDQPKAFQYTLAFKTNNGLNTANLLIANVLNKPQYCDSLFLLLRTMLADTITYFYLMAISMSEIENDENILIENIRRFEADHLEFTYNSLIVYQRLYKETDQVTAQRKAELRDKYPTYFNPDGSFKKHDKIGGIKGMVLAIAKKDLPFVTEPIKIAYSLYDKYSKYEHLGMLTSHMIVRQFDDDNKAEILNEIYHAVMTILLSQSSLLLSFLTNAEKIIFNKLVEEIEDIKIYE